MEVLNFRLSTVTKLNKMFGLTRVFSSSTLDNWLQAKPPLSDEENLILRKLQRLLILNSHGWNEQELSLHFIGPVFSAFEFTEPYRFNLFADREVKAILNNIRLEGIPDGFIASGYEEPEVPYFVFAEYKRQSNPDGDPLGQALAAMLAGQKLNPEKTPVYGCYVVGVSWWFLVLEGTTFCVSQPFTSTDEELSDIGRILKSLKQLLLQLTEKNNQPT